MKILILGLGNTLISDDGVGIIIKRYLERKLHDVANIDFCESSWGGFRIIDLFKYFWEFDIFNFQTIPLYLTNSNLLDS